MGVNTERLKLFPKAYDRNSLNSLTKNMNKKLGDMAPVIAIEELSELVQATTKWLRFDRVEALNKDRIEEDRLNIIEEIADATIALSIIKNMAGVSQSDINQMIAYKVDRDFGLLNSGKMVKGSKRL